MSQNKQSPTQTRKEAMTFPSLLRRITRRMKQSHFIHTALKVLLYGYVRLLFLTYRLEVIYEQPLKKPFDQNEGIFYFWHQHIMGGMFFFYAMKSKGHCVVSPSKDGKIVGYITEKLGFTPIYGSAYKTSISLVRKSLEVLAADRRLCLVGDGSRGPAKKLQPGVTYLAAKSDLPLIFVDASVNWAITFKKSWDQFKLPLPFCKIVIRVHKPIYPTAQHVTPAKRFDSLDLQKPRHKSPQPPNNQSCL